MTGMETPIYDFCAAYRESGTVRLHMPGHKGQPFLGAEALDLTEIRGADSLYEAEGIIARSESNAAELFGSGATLYSTEGSSQCIRAMVMTALLCRKDTSRRPVILAARNAHKTFLQACALLDADIRWLWPEMPPYSLCRCPVTARGLETALSAMESLPAAVFVTSPDYLGGELPIKELAQTAHRFGIPLLADNAHGAYLRFLPEDRHPLTLGADLCCDSAHKTLPALTGAAYLHIGRNAPEGLFANARRAMAYFGSTSPSYLILQSLDLVNRYLAEEYPAKLSACMEKLRAWKRAVSKNGWQFGESDPLKLTLDAAASGWHGHDLAERLRDGGVECEYADPDFVVLMATPETSDADLAAARAALGDNPRKGHPRSTAPTLTPPEIACSPREAAFAPGEWVDVTHAAGRILADANVSCPPAVPVAVSGERIGEDTVKVLEYYGITRVWVRK